MSLSDVLVVASHAAHSAHQRSNGASSNSVTNSVTATSLQRRALEIAIQKVKSFLRDPLVVAAVEHCLLHDMTAAPQGDTNSSEDPQRHSAGRLIVERVSRLYVDVLLTALTEEDKGNSTDDEQRLHTQSSSHVFSTFLHDKEILQAVSLRLGGLASRIERAFVSTRRQCDSDVSIMKKQRRVARDVRKLLGGVHHDLLHQIFLDVRKRSAGTGGVENATTTSSWDNHVQLSLQAACRSCRSSFDRKMNNSVGEVTDMKPGSADVHQTKGLSGLWSPHELAAVFTARMSPASTATPSSILLPLLEKSSDDSTTNTDHRSMQTSEKPPQQQSDASPPTSRGEDFDGLPDDAQCDSRGAVVRSFLSHVSRPWRLSVQQCITLLAPSRNVWALLEFDDGEGTSGGDGRGKSDNDYSDTSSSSSDTSATGIVECGAAEGQQTMERRRRKQQRAPPRMNSNNNRRDDDDVGLLTSPIEDHVISAHEHRTTAASAQQLVKLLKGWESVRAHTLVEATVRSLWRAAIVTTFPTLDDTTLSQRRQAHDGLTAFLYYLSATVLPSDEDHSSTARAEDLSSQSHVSHRRRSTSALRVMYDAAEAIQYSLQRPEVLLFGSPDMFMEDSVVAERKSSSSALLNGSSIPDASTMATYALQCDAAQLMMIYATPVMMTLPSKAPEGAESEGLSAGAMFSGHAWEGFVFSHRHDAELEARLNVDLPAPLAVPQQVDTAREILPSNHVTAQEDTLTEEHQQPSTVRSGGKIKLKLKPSPLPTTDAATIAFSTPSNISVPLRVVKTHQCGSPQWQNAAALLVQTLRGECSLLCKAADEKDSARWNGLASARPKSVVRLVVGSDVLPSWLSGLSSPLWLVSPTSVVPSTNLWGDDNYGCHATAVLIGALVLEYLHTLSDAFKRIQKTSAGSTTDCDISSYLPLHSSSSGVTVLMRLFKHCPGWWVRSLGLRSVGDILRRLAQSAAAQSGDVIGELIQHALRWWEQVS